MEFSLNEKDEIRLGLKAIKDVGENAVKEILEEREKNGKFKDIFDFVERIKVQIVNKKNLEALADSGAFDAFGIDRYKYFCKDSTGLTFIEKLIEYSNNVRKIKSSTASSLFGDADDSVSVKKPDIPADSATCTQPDQVTILGKEAEKIGLYLSNHPLDEFKPVINFFANGNLEVLDDAEKNKGNSYRIFAYVIESKLKKTKSDKYYASLELEDYSKKHILPIFNDLEKLGIKDPSVISGKVVMLKFRIENFKNAKGVESARIVVEQIVSIDEFIKYTPANIILYVPVENLNNDLTEELKSLKKYNHGASSLTFYFYNSLKEKVKLSSKNSKISLTSNLLEFIRKLEDDYGIKCKVNL
jgi:DNA polymerase-3 subunit alpha